MQTATISTSQEIKLRSGSFKYDLISLKIKDRDKGGYLEEEMPDMLQLLPPPPDTGSLELDLDLDLSTVYQNVYESRKVQAMRDAILQFPMATAAFNPVIGMEISLKTTPILYRIMQKTCVDGGSSTGSTKRFYKRLRPFMVNDLPILTPWEEEILRHDGSYPSGHTAIGWIWALILKDLFPDRSAAILNRGYQFGVSRNICNVHWHSDVVAGRICGTAVRDKLYTSRSFLNDLSLARNEINRKLG
jgi:acid phosphatase (class A)